MSDISEHIEGLSPKQRELFELLMREKKQKRASASIPRRQASDDLPLSFAQQRLWFFDQLTPGSYAYNIPTAVRILGALDVAVLARCLNDIARRHESLRTTFATLDGRPVQKIASCLAVKLPVVDLQELPRSDREAALQRLAVEDNRRAYCLAAGSLLRATLLKLGPDEQVLILNMHHTVSDGWSLGILVQEIGRLYDALLAGKRSPLPDLPIQYADYAIWQRQWLHGETLEAQLSYWKEQLRGAPRATELPLDRARPPVQTYNGALKSFVLPSALSEKLKALGKAEDATLFVTLLAAFKVLLYRYTGQTDLVIGTPVANRNRVELEGLIGFFVNTLILRTRLDGALSFRELLGRVKRVVLDGFAHQDAPFEELVDALQPERDMSRAPFFQTMFVLQNAPLDLKLSRLTLRPVRVDGGTAKFDLTLFMEESAEGLVGSFEYNTDLFHAATIDRMIGHLTTLLEGVAAQPDRRLSDLPLLTEAERRQLRDWNAAQPASPQTALVHELIEAQAERTPGAVAVAYEDRTLTYRELNQRANQLAQHLRQHGVGPESVVGLCLERSPELIVGLLGIFKAGGAYLPLDPAYPADRLAFTLSDSRAVAVLTQAHLRERLPDHAVTICLDADWPSIAQLPTSSLQPQVAPDHLAYVIYTSGSTGKPKGVMVEHRALINYLTWGQGAYRTTEGEGAPVHSSIGFDLTVTSVFLPLLSGKKVVLLREERQSEVLSAALRSHRDFSLVKVTPAHLELLSQSLPAAEVAGRTRWLIIGGEALSGESLTFWQKHAPDTRLVNEYGPTETVVGCCTYEVPAGNAISGAVPIGRPVADMQLHLLDRDGQPVPIGMPGEIYIGGPGVARGYLNRPDLTAERFLPTPSLPPPSSTGGGGRLYRTGDLARYLPDGNIEYLGRVDQQVKIRGFRIELGEIEAALLQHPLVGEAVVVAREDTPGDKRLAGYVVARDGQLPSANELRDHLLNQLPDYMIPSAFVTLDALPLTSNGKIDRRALPMPDTLRPDLKAAYEAPRSEWERAIAGIWQDVLHVEKVGLHDNFFDLGGHSLLLVQVHDRLRQVIDRDVAMIDLFRYPTIRTLVDYLGNGGDDRTSVMVGRERAQARRSSTQAAESGVAIVGIAIRFPGADNPEKFWRNLRDGVESISFFTNEEIAASGVAPALFNNPNFVKADGIVENVEWFDAGFFGYTPREAAMLDPQHRLFLECAWETLENAGYAPERFPGRIGVFAGSNLSSYLFNNLYANLDVLSAMGDFQVRIPYLLANDKDFLATRTSYKLNLRGPSIAVQTACSSAMSAIHTAAQSLLHYECDMALAGGVTIKVPQKMGYLYQKGSILPPDGHCHAFDASASGVPPGNGVGVVTLKRLNDALADGDSIYAVIKGSAMNNDGSLKVGFTAPSIEGQAEVIAEALAVAGVEPDGITMIEAHGTGTEMGDPIEVAALTQVFRAGTQRKGYCALGSVKTNIGHLDTASGVGGFVKATLALAHKQIPPSLNFERPNPKIDFANSPFFVNTQLVDWQVDDMPRRAGVSCFGMGGTNVHAILEEAPEQTFDEPRRPYQLLPLSARSADALDAAQANLLRHLQDRPDTNLADAAYTLQMGRAIFEYRRVLICSGRDDAVNGLEGREPARLLSSVQLTQQRPIAFMFPGVGDHYVRMAHELYQLEPVFRETVDRCCEQLLSLLGLDLRDVLYPPGADETSAAGLDLRQMLKRGQSARSADADRLAQTDIAQPVVFVIDYALTQLLQSWGLVPDALVGYSLGEYVAACVAGVLSLEGALTLVARRAQMIQLLQAGGMLAVSLSEADVQPFLNDDVCLAVVSGLANCVLAGSLDALTQLEQSLKEKTIACRRLETSHAFHSTMMEPIVAEFTALVRQVELHAPRIPYLSNVTGDWITAEEATDPSYWARHLCRTVRFGDSLAKLLSDPRRILLEVGPGQSLGSFAKQHPDCANEQLAHILPTMCYVYDRQPDLAFLLGTLGKVWLSGHPIDWLRFYGGERRQRIPLPTYPFERQRYWIDPPQQTGVAQSGLTVLARKPDMADWFYAPSWERSDLPDSLPLDELKSPWLLFDDTCGLSAELAKRLALKGVEAIHVFAGEAFERESAGKYTIRPQEPDDYAALLNSLEQTPQTIVHLWNVTQPDSDRSMLETVADTQALSFYSPLFLAQALERRYPADSFNIGIVSSNMQDVLGGEALCPEKATLLGPSRIIPQEYSNITCTSVDVDLSGAGARAVGEWAERLIREFAQPGNDVVAYRGNRRWTPTYKAIRLNRMDGHSKRLREGGVYLITGGLGGIGLALAEHLARSLHARLVLIGRSALPVREEWADWLATHDEHDAISAKMKPLMALEEQGAEILILNADVADLSQMQAVATRVAERFGALHGVFHAAGVAGGGMIRLKTPEAAARVLAPKLDGTLVLDAVFHDTPLDFMMLFSSQTAIVGALGQVDYCAANAFQDAFAQHRSHKPGPLVLSINWDTWQEVGMAIGSNLPDAFKEWREGNIKQGLLPEEGLEALERILDRWSSQIIVSTRDFQAILEQSIAFKASDILEELERSGPAVSAHPRPILSNAYVAPANEVEQTIAQIWQKLFGLEQVGAHDNFFDLGGHSLLLMQMHSQLQQSFGREIPITHLFQYPTIHDLAAYLGQTQPEGPALADVQDRARKYRTALKRQQQTQQSLPRQQEEDV